MADAKIDFSKFSAAQQEEVKREGAQALREKEPPYFQKQQEKEGRSEWSGASGGGGVWAGRSR
jgi:hypothetical protein